METGTTDLRAPGTDQNADVPDDVTEVFKRLGIETDEARSRFRQLRSMRSSSSQAYRIVQWLSNNSEPVGGTRDA